ncbi:HtaA domain-containing protein [Streptomyces sp. NBC_01186]|uniref:HtaA domain-containing protein n=1 Tax=Streptomyces sp. NBC_01186 TaxID=2903765 RepID=UPI003FA77BEA
MPYPRANAGRSARRRRAPHAAVALAALVAVLPALPGPPAYAAEGGVRAAQSVRTTQAMRAARAERTVSGGRLDWGIKASFQTYVTGPIAKGRYTLANGAATAGESQFRFHSAHGDYDPDSGAFNASFSGGVHFTGHREPNGTNELDLTVSNPGVRISGGSGTLYADIRSKAKGTGTVSERARVPFASLSLKGVNMRGGKGPVALSHVPARLTAEGAKSFAGYYKAGTPLDPVSLSADLKAPSGGSGQGKGEGKKKGKGGKGSGDGKSASKGRIEDAAVDWGVRRTFREYVTGPIAKGEWKLTGGAQDGGALFRFPRGKGKYDEKKGTLDVEFSGAVHFTGKALDLSLREVTVRVEDGKGTLAAEVRQGGKTAKTAEARDLITFRAKKRALEPQDDLVKVTEAPAKLTAQGARAFNGMYGKGTTMDPVSLAVALGDKAELPALPDLGSGAPSSGAKAERPKKARQAAARSDASSASSSTPLIATGAGVAVLLAAAAAFVAVRKRRAHGRTSG